MENQENPGIHLDDAALLLEGTNIEQPGPDTTPQLAVGVGCVGTALIIPASTILGIVATPLPIEVIKPLESDEGVMDCNSFDVIDSIIYIPESKKTLLERNIAIYNSLTSGIINNSVEKLAQTYALSERSIKRIFIAHANLLTLVHCFIDDVEKGISINELIKKYQTIEKYIAKDPKSRSFSEDRIIDFITKYKGKFKWHLY